MRWTHFAPLLLVALCACETLYPTEPGNLVPRTVAEDPSIPAITLNGALFHAESFGNRSGPVIVFLHGGPGGDYRSLLRMAERFGGYSLVDDNYLVFWDQRGAGLSARQEKEFLTSDVYDADLLALVDRYSPGRPVILIGHSWGGMFATEFINRHPGRVAGAVLIEPGPLTGATFERIKRDMFDLDLRREWLNDLAWSSQFLSPDDHIRMDYERTLGAIIAQPRFRQRFAPDPEPYWRLGAAAARYVAESGQDGRGIFTYDFTTRLKNFQRPVLFITGALSEVLGASLQREQVKFYPSATLHVIPNAGHDVNWTETEAVIAQVRGYLSLVRGTSQ